MDRAAFLPPAAEGIQRGINEEPRVLFYDKQQLAYIYGSDKAVAKSVDWGATFHDIS